MTPTQKLRAKKKQIDRHRERGAELNTELVEAIREAEAEGMKRTEIAQVLGVSKQYVQKLA